MRAPAGPSRYHPALVALHWLLALFLIGALVAGSLVLAPVPNTDPAKLMSFRMHMGLGVTILILMLVRLAVRLRTPHPPASPTGVALFDALAPWVHRALYAVAIAMALSGIALSVGSGLGAAVWAGGPMPADFDGMAARSVHGVLSRLLIGLIGLHIAAVLFHGIAKGDALLGRMWFGPR
jgi:cytochrome b561